MDVIQVIIQGGSVGVSVVTLWVLYKLIGNHIDHSTKAIKDLTIVLAKMDEFLRDRLK